MQRAPSADSRSRHNIMKTYFGYSKRSEKNVNSRNRSVYPLRARVVNKYSLSEAVTHSNAPQTDVNLQRVRGRGGVSHGRYERESERRARGRVLKNESKKKLPPPMLNTCSIR